MKKFSAVFLSICMIVTLMSPSMANSIVADTEAEIAYLQNLGIPVKVFESVSREKIHDWYVHAKSDTLRYGGTETVILSTNEDVISPQGTIPDEDMSLDIISILLLKKDSVTIDYVDIIVEYEWITGAPRIRREDGVTVNWDADLFLMAEDSFSSEDRLHVNGQHYKTNNIQKNPALLLQGGLGYSVQFYQLIETGGKQLKYSGSATFSLQPRLKMYYREDDCEFTSSVNVQYTHNKNVVGGAIQFVRDGFGVSITPPLLSDSVAKPKVLYYSL